MNAGTPSPMRTTLLATLAKNFFIGSTMLLTSTGNARGHCNQLVQGM